MITFRENVSLKHYTTFRIGGKARYFAEIITRDQLEKVASFAKSMNLPVVVLGGGSNVLLTDEVIEAFVIRLMNKKVVVREKTASKVFVTAGAGKNWDEFVGEMVRSGYQGIECLSGIPGTVGAAPIQNIGAYGQEIKDTFEELEAYDLKDDKFVVFLSKDCKFGYRDSVFKSEKNKGRFVIFSVTFRLKIDAKPSCRYESLAFYLNEHNIEEPTLLETRNAVLAVRDMKLENPEKVYNSGSFFRNPVVSKETVNKLRKKYPDIPSFPFGNKMKIPAGWLIERAGWKGKKYKNVGVSDKHALVLVNPMGKGTAVEIKELAQNIQDDVKEKFGVTLLPEVNYIN